MNLIHPGSDACLGTAMRVDILTSMITIRCCHIVTPIGLASITLLSLIDSGLTLPAPQITIPISSANQGNFLFVNPKSAAANSNGSQAAPFKTITQALKVAPPNSVIVLSPGTYSTDSGEAFPLKLKPRVAIQGDRRTRGSNIIIQGGGTFLSPTFARQNITILGADEASLTGVTVTNSNPRGYGLWIESSNLLVSDNTFTRNNHDGISITGNSTSTVRSNYFHQNGANGMTIYGTSRPEVRDNVFEKTGFGINIAQKAAPIIIGNHISQNRSGIITQAQAQPVLRSNVIEGNTEDGLVAIATSQPNLGTKTQPGGNIFRQNKRFDINASASKQVIPAFGNQLAARTSGNIDLVGTVEVATIPATPTLARTQIAKINHQKPSSLASPQTARINNQARMPVILQPKLALLQSAQSADAMTTPIEIPVPPPASSEEEPVPSSLPQVSFRQINSSTPQTPTLISASNTQSPASGSDTLTEIPIPLTSSQELVPPPPKTGSISQNLPVLKSAQIEAELLPVPSGNIPIGNTRNQPKVPVRRVRTTSAEPPLPPTRATSLGLRYRVVVEAGTTSKQDAVRSLVPGAFRTFSNGRVFMQVGAFSDRLKADEMLQMVNSKGLRGTIEQMN